MYVQVKTIMYLHVMLAYDNFSKCFFLYLTNERELMPKYQNRTTLLLMEPLI
jgi:hypothetical protein